MDKEDLSEEIREIVQEEVEKKVEERVQEELEKTETDDIGSGGNEQEGSGVSRRGFLKGLGALGVGALAMSSPVASKMTVTSNDIKRDGVSAFLDLPGTNSMSGNLDMQGNDIFSGNGNSYIHTDGSGSGEVGFWDDNLGGAKLRINEDGPVEILNENLDLNGNPITNITNFYSAGSTRFWTGGSGNDNFEFVDNANNQNLVQINEGGPVEVSNANLEMNGNAIREANGLVFENGTTRLKWDTDKSGSSFYIQRESSTSETFMTIQNENVSLGKGVSSPNDKVHLAGSTRVDGRIDMNSNNITNVNQINGQDVSEFQSSVPSSGNDMVVNSGGQSDHDGDWETILDVSDSTFLIWAFANESGSVNYIEVEFDDGTTIESDARDNTAMVAALDNVTRVRINSGSNADYQWSIAYRG